MIRRFESKEYYTISIDPRILSPEHNKTTSFTAKGKSVIQEYYNKKYATQYILLPENLSKEEALVEIKNHIQDIQNSNKNKENDRHVFVIQERMGLVHALTIAYLKENGEEAILYADSLGENKSSILKLKEFTGIPIYSVKERRQSDGYSCFSDAFVFARDITGKNARDYLTKNLLSKLKERSEPQEGYYNVKLPNELLKTAQTPEFLGIHQNTNRLNEIIHKNATQGYTLTDFRELYTDKDVTFKSEKKNEPVKKDMASYPRIKGNKYGDLIQIQYYLNAIKQATYYHIDTEELFRKGAKDILKTQLPQYQKEEKLFEYANAFLKILLIKNNNGNQKELFANLSSAANQGFFPTLFEITKDNINIQDLFEYSIDKNEANLLNALLDHHIITPSQTYNDDGENELSMAIDLESDMAVSALLKRGASVNLLNERGETPLHLALYKYEPNLDIIKALLENGADINACDSNGNTPLHLATKSKRVGLVPKIVELFLKHGPKPNLANKEGNTPLHLAVIHNIAVAKDLLDHPGIDPTIKNTEGLTPSDLASKKKISVYREAVKKMSEITTSKQSQPQDLLTSRDIASSKRDIESSKHLRNQGIFAHSGPSEPKEEPSQTDTRYMTYGSKDSSNDT